MIELKHIDFSYGEKKILSDFNLTVNDGDCVCLSGPSGCGKTTVLRLIAGLEKPDSGTIKYADKISYVFQEDRLVPNLSVLNNILLCSGNKKDFALSVLEQAGLKNIADKKPQKLSGGMKRRVAIVRAVVFGGDALLLDEPFNGLDEEAKKIMAEIVKREFTEKGKPVIMVSHIPEDCEIMNARKIEFNNTANH